ncbi:MAG TPA: sporulation transcription factor Spo0A [Firmicutes bacterium]|nr:sporulation transcription factor Spo0A [Bacillota bacterium]HBR28544.1 sporulation transcription factor Spo0A [Bacillota bacterium]HBR34312.1 sporulation transcription factor Spo0A [Bacillota bacterium]
MTLSGKIKIGLAEDNLEFCQVLNDYLQAHPDLEVAAVAYDGQQTLEMVRTTKLHLLLLDLIMPKLDGIAVLERIKMMDNRPKIIILSAFGHEEMTRKAVELGADYFIVKPFDLQILVQRIREVCGSQSPAAFTAYTSPARQAGQIEQEVTDLLQKMKIPPHFKGYTYLRKAILLCIKEPTLINEVTKKLYPRIAEEYNSTANRVERSMRFAIETAWSRGEIEYLHELMGPIVDEKKGKPTNVSFIAKISDKIRLNYNLRN